MKIAIATVQVPFIRGGAENLANGLIKALCKYGHSAELITMPFRFWSPGEVLRSMNAWASENFTKFDCGTIDKVICLKFPTYYLQHLNKVIWLLHQHRGVYELFGTPYGSVADRANDDLRREIMQRDTAYLGDAKAIFTIAKQVSNRLKKFNTIDSQWLYHPPAQTDHFYCSDQLPYIFFPSRLETLKRQELLVRAMAYVRSPVCAIIAGEGGLRPQLERLIEELGLKSRVRLVGRVSTQEMLAWYANSLGVFFGPYDEDYGYVTLEAMLSSKPVITCTDSGGPLEFVVDKETGFVVEPVVEQIAEAIERLYSSPRKARDQGQAGLMRYRNLGISWSNVVNKLVYGEN
ncbi:MAG: glycosyltransferase family 4 protein [Candidatus Competibacteraceae bacterium]